MIHSVKIKNGCISCRTCERICPKVFKVQNGSSTVISDNFEMEKDIKSARDSCPVQVISVEVDNNKEDGKEVSKTKFAQSVIHFFKQLIFEGKIPFLKYIKRFLLLLAALTPLIWYFPDSWRDLGELAWNILVFIIAIRPLADLFPKIKLFRALVPLRKETGILCAALVLAHGSGYYLSNNWPIIRSFFDFQFWTFNNNAGYAHVGGVLAFILLITSNKWAQIILKKNWKRIQYLAYAFFLSGGLHIVLIGGDDSIIVLIEMVVLIILWLLAHFKVVIFKE